MVAKLIVYYKMCVINPLLSSSLRIVESICLSQFNKMMCCYIHIANTNFLPRQRRAIEGFNFKRKQFVFTLICCYQIMKSKQMMFGSICHAYYFINVFFIHISNSLVLVFQE